MGIYINTGNLGFQSARNSEYIDKSGLISVVNSTLFTERRFSCITRCRRFGKSMAAKMLCAYYDQSCDSRSLFADLQIANDPQFEKHLNKYPVIYLDVSDFVTRFKDETIMQHINEEMKADIHEAYPDVPVKDDDDLMALLIRINAKNDYIVHRELATGKGFADIVLIPRKNVDSPAIVVELKYNKDADAAIDQIRRKQYPAKVAQYADRLLLVGINYNRETKTHECVISKG